MTTRTERASVRRAFRSGTLSFDIVASQDLRIDEHTGSGWISDGEDPVFLLAPVGRPQRIFSGLVRVRADLKSTGATVLDPLLYYADETGFSETNIIPLSVSAAGVDELIELPSGVTELRIDPVTGAGRFTFSKVVITRPLWRERCKRLIEAVVFRRRYAMQAVPQTDLRSEGAGRWRSTGDDPCFFLVPPIAKRAAPRGWLRLRANLASESGTRLSPVLYIDEGEGFREGAAVPLRVEDGLIDTVIFVPETALGLRLDPLSAPGIFHLSDVVITSLNGLLGHEPLRRRIQHLIGGRRFEVDVVPQQQLELHGERSDLWRSKGDDPCFYLSTSRMGREPPRGWMRIKARLAPEGTTKLDPVLYLDDGQGFREETATRLRVRDGRIDDSIYIPPTTAGLRLDPVSAPGIFYLSDVVMTSLSGMLGGEPSLHRIQALNAGRRFEVEAVPLQHLECKSEGSNLWRSYGDDPCFHLVVWGMGREAPRGWLRIGATLAPEGTTKLDPVLYLDDGKGFREATAIRLRVRNGRIDDTVYVPSTTVGLRLDPMSAAGPFRLSNITVAVVSGVRGWVANLLNIVDAIPDDKRGASALMRQTVSFITDTPRAEKWQRFVDASRLKLVPASYAAWIDQVETPARPSTTEMRAAIASFRAKPLISVIMPVYNTPERWLRAALASVAAQGYPHWELCLCDDNSPAPHIKPMLEAFAKKDTRVKLRRRTENGRIAVASNEAMAMASGRYMVLMDHDDVIPDNALFEFARLLDEDDTIDFIYSDEDKLSTDEIRYEPFFKPDWSPDYLESCMYTAHLALYRSDIARDIGGFRDVCNGAQDYDFVLRYTERVRNVRHVQKILYHWRAIPGSTAQAMDNKDYVIAAAVRALTDRAERTGELDFVKPTNFGGCFTLRRKLKERPLVSIVIPSAGRDSEVQGKTVDLLAACLESLREVSTYDRVEIVVVDNGDLRPNTLASLDRHGARRMTYREPVFNVAAKMNLGASIANGDVLVFLNDDIEVMTPDWLEAMLAILQKPGVGAVGPKLLFENGELQHAGITFSDGFPDHVRRGYPGEEAGYYFSTSGTRNYLAVTGACVMLRRADFEAIGGFDEKFAVNYNDIDLCLKLWERGLRIVYTGQASLHHYESRNRARTVEAAEKALFLERWGTRLVTDPFYCEWLRHRPPTFELDPIRF